MPSVPAGIAIVCLCVVVGCGGARPGARAHDAGTVVDGRVPLDSPPSDDDGGIPPSDAGRPAVDGGEPVACTPVSSLGLEHLVGPFGSGRGGAAVDPTSHRVLALPDRISSTLRSVMSVAIGDASATAAPLRATGELPTGTVAASIWSRTLGKMVAIIARPDYTRYDVATIELRGDEAVFDVLDAAGSPPAPTFSSWLAFVALDDGQLVGVGPDWATVMALRIDGGVATWSAARELAGGPPPGPVFFDAPRSRLVVFSPEAGSLGLFSLALPSGARWDISPVTGDALRDGALSSYGAVDHAGGRLILRLQYPDFDPAYRSEELRSLDLAAARWSLLRRTDHVPGSALGGHRAALAVDDTARRAIDVGVASASVMELGPGHEGEGFSSTLDAYIGAFFTESATALPDGRLVTFTDNEMLLAMDPEAPLPRWQPLGISRWDAGPPIVYDAGTSRLWLRGGLGGRTMMLHEVGLDGSRISSFTPSDALTARTLDGTLVHDGVLYVVGGEASGSVLGDVWAIDLRARTARHLADLVQPRTTPLLVLTTGGELWVAGGATRDSGTSMRTGVESIVAIDVSTGAMRDVRVAGAWPPTGGYFAQRWSYGDHAGIVALVPNEIGSVEAVDLWALERDGSDGARWVGGDACAYDVLHEAVLSTAAAAMNETTAYLVGSNVWRVGPR